MQMIIVKANPEQALQLSDLALRSKAHWNYTAQFMQQVKAELTYTPESIKRHQTFVAQIEGQVVGFYQLIAIEPRLIELQAMFVEPAVLGQGVGKELFSHATQVAKEHGFATIKIQADPNAAEFYLQQGCEQIGEEKSLSIPGRHLPLMQFKL